MSPSQQKVTEQLAKKLLKAIGKKPAIVAINALYNAILLVDIGNDIKNKRTKG